MGRDEADAWFEMARDAIRAARRITRKHPRSLVSRAYYSIFAHVHGRLIEVGQSPRGGLGTWSHQALPALVASHLTKPLGLRKARDVRLTRTRMKRLRELADYQPDVTLDAEVAFEALRSVERIVGK